MTWFKVDDEVPVNHKFAALCEGPCRSDAIALWTFAGCWSSRALKAGFVPTGVIASYGFHSAAASELVRVGLWDPADGGFMFHDWADYQPSAEQIEQRRRAGAERKARSRARLSSAKPESSVGESRRDDPTVTGVPRTESRGCLAHASRERENSLSSNSSSSERARADFERSPVPTPPPDLPPPEHKREPWLVVWKIYEKLLGLEGALGHPAVHRQALDVVVGAAKTEAGNDNGVDFERAAKRILEAWQAEKFVRDNKPPLKNIISNIQKYARPKTLSKAQVVDLRSLSDEEFFRMAKAGAS